MDCEQIRHRVTEPTKLTMDRIWHELLGLIKAIAVQLCEAAKTCQNLLFVSYNMLSWVLQARAQILLVSTNKVHRIHGHIYKQ